MDIILLVVLAVCSYFLGNINFARILSGLKHEDITSSGGSGNPGATSMLRKYGFKFGVLTLFLDAVKGAIPSLAGFLIFGGAGAGLESLIALYVCGLSTIIGHIYPIFYKFKGGKGISTTLGMFAVAQPLVMLIVFICAFIFVWFVEYVSVASLMIVTVLTIYEVVQIPADADLTLTIVLRIILFLVAFLTWFAHRANILRLLVGKENKASLKKSLKKMKKQDKKNP